MEKQDENGLAVLQSPAHGNAQSASKAASTNSNVEAASVEKNLEPVGAEKPPREITGIAWGLVVLSILMSTFLFALDNTITADIQPAIIKRFGEINKLPWLAAAFFLSASATNLFW